jgi:hypothetical protein
MEGGEAALDVLVRLGSRERERLLDLECARGLRSLGRRNMVVRSQTMSQGLEGANAGRISNTNV